MKTAVRLCQLLVLSLLLQLSGRAFAQGCGLVPTNTDEGIICSGHRILDQYCGGNGNSSYYCYEGYGVCSATGEEFTTANVGYDEDCGGGVVAVAETNVVTAFEGPAVTPSPMFALISASHWR